MAKKTQDLSSKKTAPRAARKKPSKSANSQVSGGQMTEQNKKTTSSTSTERGFSPEMIGFTAGEIWNVLSERGFQSLAGVKKAVDAPDDLIMAAIGWLAREDKLTFDASGRTVKVSLR